MVPQRAKFELTNEIFEKNNELYCEIWTFLVLIGKQVFGKSGSLVQYGGNNLRPRNLQRLIVKILYH